MNPAEWFVSMGQMLIALGDGLNMIEARQQRLAREVNIRLEIPTEITNKVTDEMRQVILETHARFSESDWLRPNGPRDQICVRFNLTGNQVRAVLGAETYRNNNGTSEVTPPTSEPPVTTPVPTEPPEVVPQPDPVEPPEPVKDPEPAATIAPVVTALAEVPMGRRSRGIVISGVPPFPSPKVSVRRLSPSAISPPVQTVRTVDLSTITIDPNTWPTRVLTSTLNPPTEKVYEVDSVDRHICDLLVSTNRFDKLKGRFAKIRHLTRQQVNDLRAGVADRSGIKSDSTLEPLSNPARPTPPVLPGAITCDPASWPRISETGKRSLTDLDRTIVHLLIDEGRYDELKAQVMERRALTGQQVAWIKASYTIHMRRTA